VARELHDVAPEIIEVCESMILDGVDERGSVTKSKSASVSETSSAWMRKNRDMTTAPFLVLQVAGSRLNVTGTR
jgi:hypothetical protein